MAYENTDPTGVEGSDSGDLLDEIKKKWKLAKDGTAQWRADAREDFEFVSGRQWSDEDKAFLENQRRPVITFNRCGVFVEAVSGAEVNNRQEVRYTPREMGDVQVNEILTEAGKWVRDNCNAEDEESEGFRDATICGIGVTETHMEYEDDPEGRIVIDRRDPLKYWWDPASRKKCLEDRTFDFFGEWIRKEDLPEEWQEKITSSWSDGDEGRQPRNADVIFAYKGEEKEDHDESQDRYFLLHYECRKKEPFFRVTDPVQGKNIILDAEQFEKLRELIERTGIPYVEQRKWVYYRAFLCGNEILEYGKSPCQVDFTRQVITARRDRNRNCWYGIVRDMKDPQRWANKWLSQVLHIINTNSKGGAFIEETAVDDWKKLEEQWGSNDAPLIKLNEGGLGKVQERQSAQYPTGLDRLMMFAFESMPFVSGINLEALGLANREQAGVLEAQRKQAAFGILAPLFDALRRYRKAQGRVMLYFIDNYISDGRLIRIGGQSIQPQYVPLTKQEGSASYDIVVDDSPTSPDVKQKTWENIVAIMPAMLKTGFPVPPEVLDYMPTNSVLAQKWKQHIQQNKQLPPQVMEKMREMDEQIKMLSESEAKLKEQNMTLRMDHSAEVMKLQQNARDSMMKNTLKAAEIERESATAAMQANVEEATRKFEAILDARVKLITAGVQAATKNDETRSKEATAAVNSYAERAAARLLDPKNITKIVEDALESNRITGISAKRDPASGKILSFMRKRANGKTDEIASG